ncbi:MAG: hypothetical protein JKY54_18840, partial [Flavobacteriales bacterium]|nr:hypothetical protein [Flavobacteriales bacterium]
MKTLRRSPYYGMILSCILLSSCNWVANKKEHVEKLVIEEVEQQIEHIEQRIDEEIEQHILPPIAEGIYSILDGIFNSPYDSIEAAKDCAEERPNPLVPVSSTTIGETGYQYSIIADTPDSVLSHIDASFFEVTDRHYPLTFPFFLKYSEILGYLSLDINYCKFSNLPSEYGVFPYKEIFQIGVHDQFL